MTTYKNCDLTPQPQDKVKWMPLKKTGSSRGVVDYIIGDDVYVYIPHRLPISAEKDNRTRYRKSADQLELLERPGDLTHDLSSL